MQHKSAHTNGLPEPRPIVARRQKQLCPTEARTLVAIAHCCRSMNIFSVQSDNHNFTGAKSESSVHFAFLWRRSVSVLSAAHDLHH